MAPSSETTGSPEADLHGILHRSLVTEAAMERVLGIGGIFFKARDPKALLEWYRTHLGIEPHWEGGSIFESRGAGEQTVWAAFPQDTNHFNPSPASFSLNYRVANLERMLEQLRAMGAQVDGTTQTGEYGKFGWVMDPEGNRIELWEPPSGG
jgi:predicted enzyme related to lactoylglutathione lyase